MDSWNAILNHQPTHTRPGQYMTPQNPRGPRLSRPKSPSPCIREGQIGGLPPKKTLGPPNLGRRRLFVLRDLLRRKKLRVFFSRGTFFFLGSFSRLITAKNTDNSSNVHLRRRVRGDRLPGRRLRGGLPSIFFSGAAHAHIHTWSFVAMQRP